MGDDKIQKQNVGNAGEYYIAARLSALDFTATLTLGRAEKYDILALSPTGRIVKISVKATQRDGAKDFPLSNKDEEGASDDFFYVFVKLNKFVKEPDFWVIPSKVVNLLVSGSNKRFLDRGNKDNSVRLLPITLTKGARLLFPETWEEEVSKYYKNLKQLL